MVEKISILQGKGKNLTNDKVERVDFYMGDIVSIVGQTGSGKTTLINDIELFAEGNTPTQRTILLDDKPASVAMPKSNPIALITQHTNFLSDLPVMDFLLVHAKVRFSKQNKDRLIVEETLDFANQLTGEAIMPDCKMTELSGGQTRALLIADATIICQTPIVLLDEVENAGINRTKALELLRGYRKIFIFVTHDPRIALLSDYRVVMEGGAIKNVLITSQEERQCSEHVNAIDDYLTSLREKIRKGLTLSLKDKEVVL